MSWWERQGERDQPVFDAETKQWTWREDRTPPWARRLALVFRGIAATARLAVLALLVMALLRGWWVAALIAALLVAISLGMAWASNQGAPASAKRRIWWP